MNIITTLLPHEIHLEVDGIKTLNPDFALTRFKFEALNPF